MGGKKVFLLATLVILSGLVGGFLSGAIFLGHADAVGKNGDIISAKRFNLIDDNEKVRASLCFEENGYPAIAFLDLDQKVLSYFALTKSGPMIVFRDSDKRSRMMINLDKEGEPSIIFFGKNKNPNLALTVSNTNEPVITLYDYNKTPRMMMTVQDKSPRIGFVEGKKNMDLLLTTRPDGQGGLVMQNKHGQIVLGMYNNAPVLVLKKGDGTESITGFFPNGQPFTGLRENGKTTWIAPEGKQTEMQEIAPSSDWQKITDSLLKQPNF